MWRHSWWDSNTWMSLLLLIPIQHLITARVLLYPKHRVILSKSIKRRKCFSSYYMLPCDLQRPCLVPLSVSKGYTLFGPHAVVLSARSPDAFGPLEILLLWIRCYCTKNFSAERFESCSSGWQQLNSLLPIPKVKNGNCFTVGLVSPWAVVSPWDE